MPIQQADADTSSKETSWVDWFLTIRSDDPNVVRRGKNFLIVQVLLGLLATVVSMIILPLVTGNPAQWLVPINFWGTFTIVVALCRFGYVDVAGVLTALPFMVMLAINVPNGTFQPELVWFYPVPILVASFAVRSWVLLGLWAVSQAGLIYIWIAAGGAANPEMLRTQVPFSSFLLLMVALTTYWQSRATERAFLRQHRANTNLRLARHEAEEANRAKSTFLANMSHELRTPLNAVIGYSELLREEYGDTEDDMGRDLENIHAAGRQLLGLINDILDISKIEADRLDLNVAAFSAPSLIQEVSVAVEPLIRENHNTLTVDIDDTCGEVTNDSTRLRQILLNLLSNAAKFTHHGEIHLHASLLDQSGAPYLRVAVADTGIGMTPEQQSRVFDLFEQADKSTSRDFGGTGLGLALVKRLTELMGGWIDLESAPDEGSTFTVTIAAHLDDFVQEEGMGR